MSLSQEEIDACHEAFREVDVSRRGHIDVWELRIVLQGNHERPLINAAVLVKATLDCDSTIPGSNLYRVQSKARLRQ